MKTVKIGKFHILELIIQTLVRLAQTQSTLEQLKQNHDLDHCSKCVYDHGRLNDNVTWVKFWQEAK